MSLSDMPTSPATGPIVVPATSGASFIADSPPQLYRFTVDEFYRMDEAGLFSERPRVELIEGLVTMMSPIGPPHSVCVELLNRVFIKLLPAGFDYRTQHGLVIAENESVPQPDGCVVRGTTRDYSSRHPAPADVALIVEVADSSLKYDRTTKHSLYATASIAEYWIVDLNERRLEVFRNPAAAVGEQPARYESAATYAADDTIEVVLDGRPIGRLAVKDILP